MIPIITIRPEEGARSTAAHARQDGAQVLAFPLFDVVPVAWRGPDPAQIDALLLGSANAVVHAGRELARYAGKPVHAVGRRTAQAAWQSGLAIGGVGEGGLQQVVNALGDAPVRLLRLAGKRHVALELPANLSVETRVVYDVKASPIPDALLAVLREGAVVMLHSGAAAEHFRAECERLGLDLGRIRIAAFGPRIAEAAGEGWGEVRAAQRPEGGAMLALARDMCH